MYEEGIALPYPLQVQGTEILMEFIGDGAVAAPRLVQVRCSPSELADYFDQVRRILLGFARVGTAHGDLSAYNLLVHHSRVVAIDVPQLVEVISTPGAWNCFVATGGLTIRSWAVWLTPTRGCRECC